MGLALSRLLAKEQANLALLARKEEILRQLADELRESGSAVLPVRRDVSDGGQVGEGRPESMKRTRYDRRRIQPGRLPRPSSSRGPRKRRP